MKAIFKGRIKIALLAICLVACIVACIAVVASASGPAAPTGEMIDISTNFAAYKVQDTVRIDNDGHVGALQYTVYYDKENHTFKTGVEGTPVIVYTINHPGIARIGQDDNKTIIQSMLNKGYAVIVLDYLGSSKAVSPAIENSAQAFRSSLRTGKILSTTVFAEGDICENFLVPSGYNVLLHQVFWEIDKHSAEGTLEKIVENWNSDFRATKGSKLLKWVHTDGTRKAVQNDFDGNAPKWYNSAGKEDANGQYTYVKFTKAETITDCVDPDGSFIDMNLYINVVYPTRPVNEVPVMSLANSSGYPTTSVTGADLRPHSNGFLYNGYANVVFDYLWQPMARTASWGYYDGSAGVTQDHMNYGLMMYNDKLVNTAAMRYLRYISLSGGDTYNFDLDAFGVYGNSKGGWFAYLGEAVLQSALVKDTAGMTEAQKLDAITDALAALVPDRYYNGHHGETRYQVGAGSITKDGFTVKAGEVQPWLLYNGTEIISGVQFTNPCNGSQQEDITAGHSPVFISGNMTDTYNAAFGYSNDIYNICRELDIPILQFEVPIGHTLTSGMDMNYNLDTYDAYFRYVNYFLKGDAISVAYVSPMPDAGGVRVTDKITIGFAGKTTLAEVQKITLTAGNTTVSGSWESSCGGVVWTFIPDSLSGATEYTLTIPATFAGHNGKAMGTAYTTGFITEYDNATAASASGNYYTLKAPAMTGGNSFVFRFLVENDAANVAELYAVSATGATDGTLLGSVNLRGAGAYEIDITDYIAANTGKDVVLLLKGRRVADTYGAFEDSFDSSKPSSTNSKVTYTIGAVIDGKKTLKAVVTTPQSNGVSVYYSNPTHIFTYPKITGGEITSAENYGRRYTIAFDVYDTTERVLQLKLNWMTNRTGYGTIDYNHVIRNVKTVANGWTHVEFTYDVYEPDYGFPSASNTQSLAVYVSPGGSTNAPIYFDNLTVKETVTDITVGGAVVAEKDNGRGAYTAPVSTSPFAVYNGTTKIGEYAGLKAAFGAYKSGYTIKLQRNYILKDSDLYDGMGGFAEVNIDLGGYTVTSANTNNSFIWAKAYNTPDVVTEINVSGGSVLLGRTPLVSYESSTSQGSGKSFDISFDNVYIGFAENAWTTEIISDTETAVGVTVNSKISLNNCTLDFPDDLHAKDASMVFPAPTIKTLNVSYGVTGGSIAISSQRWITILENAKIVEFFPAEGGKYTTLKMPLSITTSVLGSYLISDGYASFEKQEVNGNIVTYTLEKADDSTRYGIIPDEYSDVNAYPLVLFKDGVFVSAHADMKSVINAAGTLLKGEENADEVAEILLRRNLVSAAEPTFGGSCGTVIFDLGGHTVVRSTVLINAVVTGDTPMYDTTFIYKNGRMETASKVMGVNHMLYTTDKVKTYNFTFENVTFGFNEALTASSVNGIFWGVWQNGHPTTIQTNVTFNDCIFDLKSNAPSGGGTLFNFNNTYAKANVRINGGEFIGGGASFKLINSDSGDSITMGEGENGFPVCTGGLAVTDSFRCDDGKYRKFKAAEGGGYELVIDELVTPYGVISSEFADAEKYPFAIFLNGSFKTAATHFANTVDGDTGDSRDALDAAKGNGGHGAGNSANTVYILLRRDYNADYLGTTESYNNLSQFGATLVIDLNGYSFTTGSGRMFGLTAKATNSIIHNTTFIVKNGTLVLSGKNALIGVGSSSSLTSSKTFDMTFEGVTFKSSASASASIVTTSKGDGTAAPKIKIDFNGCIFDYSDVASKHTLFALTHTNDNVSSEITFNNSKFISNAAAMTKITVCTKAANDSIVFGPETELEYPASDTPAAVVFPMQGGNGYFVKASVTGATATYHLEPVKTAGGTISESTINQNLGYLSTLDYPFFVYENGVFVSAHKTWKSAVGAAVTCVSDSTDTVKSEAYILLRRDYDVSVANSDKGTNFNGARGTVVVDLGGHTLNAIDTYFVDIHIPYATSSSILGYQSSIRFTNGTMINKRTNLASIGLGHDGTPASGYSRKVFNFTFENITFSMLTHPIMQDWGHANPTGLEINLVCNDCTFDYSYATAGVKTFAFASGQKNVILKAEFNGSKVIAANFASYSIYTSGAEDTVTIGKGSDGRYMTVIQSSDAAAPTVSFVSTSGASLSFGIEDVSGGNTEYILGEPIKTPYGDIPFTYQSEEDYPFVVFDENGKVLGAYNIFYGANQSASAFGKAKDYLAANVYNGSEYTGTVRSAYILLRRDYTMAENETFNNVAQVQGVLTIDLGGYTFTSANTRPMFPACIKPWGGSGDAKVFPSIFEIINGEIVVRNKALIEYNAWTGGKESTNTPGTDVSGKAFDFHFTGVTFNFTEAANARLISYSQHSDTPNAEGNPTVIFNDCTFDLSAAKSGIVIFDLGNGKIHTTIKVNGGEIIADNTDFTMINKVSGCKSDITFGRLENGNYVSVVLPSGIAAPTGEYNITGGLGVFVKVSDNGTEAIYRLVPKAAAELNFVPEASITLGSELTFNIYVPAHQYLTSLTLDGETVDISGLTEKDGYYLVTVKLGASEAARDIILVTGFNVDGTSMKGRFVFSIPRYAEKVLSDESISSYEKTLVKDVLSYIRAAYAYFGTTDAEALAKIDELLGENYDESSAPVMNGDAEKPTLGITAVTYNLTAKPGLRFYLAEGFKASDFAFSINGSAVAAEEGSDANGKYVEVKLYAYELAETVDYTVNGESDSCHIKCYYEWAKTENNDNLVKLVLRFAKYCESAAAYRESVIN